MIRRSRREVQRTFPPGTLFSFYSYITKRLELAMVLWWESVKTSPRHPAGWRAKFIRCGGAIDYLMWERFNENDVGIEGTNDKSET